MKKIIAFAFLTALSAHAFAQQAPTPSPRDELAVYQQMLAEANDRLVAADARVIALMNQMKASADKAAASSPVQAPAETPPPAK